MRQGFDKRIYVAVALSPLFTFLAFWVAKSILALPSELMNFVHAIATALK